MAQCIAFPPIAAADARLLILGSLPGVESLRQGQYYAKKENSFWRIMGDIAGAVPTLPYDEQLALLKRHKIALWDVCASAFRPGSLDSSIEPESVVPNDFAAFLRAHHHIQMICFNGQPAAKLYTRRVLPHLPASMAALRREILPSTSPAHARMRFDEKLAQWKAIIGSVTRK